MLEFDVARHVPKFILADKNGYALAKAIEAGLRKMNQIVQDGIDCVIDTSTMPEWRLDELAWEYNLLYDYTADVETKRKWIEKARWYAGMYGTKAGINAYLAAAFDSSRIDEWFEYGGDPFHFRVQVTGEYTPESNAWAIESVNRIKSLRSVLDEIIFNSGTSEAWILSGAAVSGMEIRTRSRSIDPIPLEPIEEEMPPANVH